MARKVKQAGFKYIGTLPVGDWQFCVVQIQGQADAVIVVDRTGQNAPRAVIGDKLKILGDIS